MTTERKRGAERRAAGRGWIKQHTESEISHCKVRDDNRLTSALSSPRFQQLVGNAINIRNYATSPPTLLLLDSPPSPFVAFYASVPRLRTPTGYFPSPVEETEI